VLVQIEIQNAPAIPAFSLNAFFPDLMFELTLKLRFSYSEVKASGVIW
jgi:hypothetical protein